jgi:hypothetical protein
MNIRRSVNCVVCEGIGTVSLQAVGTLAMHIHLICIFNGTDSTNKYLLKSSQSLRDSRKSPSLTKPALVDGLLFSQQPGTIPSLIPD